MTDVQKKDLFSETRGTNVFLGKASTAADNNVKNMLRITINPNDRYVSVNMFYLWGSTNGSTWYAKLEYQTYANHDTTTWTTSFENKPMGGWSGNNVVYFNQVQGFNRNSSQSANIYALRFTFHQTAINASYSSACLSDIRCFGLNTWTSPNNIVGHNRLYKWDSNLNATFPAQLTATQFNGSLSGTATKATADASGNTITSTYAKKVKIYTFNLPTTGWTYTSSESTVWKYSYKITNSNVSATSIVEVAIPRAGISVAEKAGLGAFTESYAGYFLIYAQDTLESAISSVEYHIVDGVNG